MTWKPKVDYYGDMGEDITRGSVMIDIKYVVYIVAAVCGLGLYFDVQAPQSLPTMLYIRDGYNKHIFYVPRLFSKHHTFPRLHQWYYALKSWLTKCYVHTVYHAKRLSERTLDTIKGCDSPNKTTKGLEEESKRFSRQQWSVSDS